MPWTTILGAIAALCSTVSFVPQAVKVIRTQDTKDLSRGMYALTVSGFAFWTTYGVLLRQWPLIAANGICLVLSAFILAMTLLSNRHKHVVIRKLKPKRRS
jgi:MtN3 and saliva related transmembrane protein